MAIEEEDLELDEAASKKGKSGKLKIIIIALVVLVLMGASIGGTLYFLGGSDEEMAEEEDGVADGATNKKKAAKEGEAVQVIYHAFTPPFVVNFEDKGVVRFLQVGLSVMTHDETVPASLQQHDPVIRNNLVLLFSGKSFKELTSREGKETLRQETLKEIQSIMKKHADNNGVEEVFFTSFVIQ